MAEIISNEKIQAFIEERKCIHDQWRDTFITRWNGNSQERILDIVGDAGHEFRVIVRENKFNPSRNFSVILGVYYPTPNKVFRLLRYNGSNHCHMRHIRYECHIHRATEEYQNAKEREDSYAEKTSRYQDVFGALRCLMDDANFQGNPTLLQEVKSCLLGL